MGPPDRIERKRRSSLRLMSEAGRGVFIREREPNRPAEIRGSDPHGPMRASGSERKDDGPSFGPATARDGFTLVKSGSAKGKVRRLGLGDSASMPRGKRGRRRSAEGSRLL